MHLAAQIYRPRALAPKSANDADAIVTAAPRWRAVVVDDDIDCVWSLATILELEGHEVRMAFDGESALELAQSFQPGLVILDIAMPRIDGYEVCRRLRAMPDGWKRVIAAMTGFGHASDKLRSLKAGFDIHMLKPVDPGELNRLLSGLMPRPD